MQLLNLGKRILLILVYSIAFYCQIEKIEIEWLSACNSPLRLGQYLQQKQEKGTELLGLSVWMKIQKQINQNYLKDILSLSAENQDKLLIQIEFNGLQFQIITYHELNNKKQRSFLSVQESEWYLLFISFQKQIIISFLQNSSNSQLQTILFDPICNLVQLTAKNPQFLKTTQLMLYQGQQKIVSDKFSQLILNYEIQKQLCNDLTQLRDFKITCFLIDVQNEINSLQNDKKNSKHQLILKRHEEIQSIIFSFNIFYLQERQFSRVSILKVDEILNLILSNDSQQLKLKLIINGEEFNLGILEAFESYITIQIEGLGQSSQKIDSYFNKKHFKQILEIQQKSEIFISEQIMIQFQQQANELLGINQMLLLTNYKIDSQQSSSINSCLIKVTHILNNNDKRCIIRDINHQKEKLQPIQSVPDLNRLKKRNLQATTYIHGTNMMSLRNFYQNSENELQISPRNIPFLVFGYFKQSIFDNNIKYPLITIGDLYIYEIFLNLYYDSKTSVQLRWNERNSLDIKTFSYSLAGDASGKWIGLGIGYSPSLSNARIYYAGTSNGSETSLITVSDLFTGVVFKDDNPRHYACITCYISSNYKQFNGQVSTVKLIYSVDITSNTSLNIFRENLNKQSSILNLIDLSSYVPNSEYDLGQSFDCNTDYAFFEGVCVYKNYCKNLVIQSDENWQFESGKFYNSSTKKCQTCMSDCMICTSLDICTQCRSGYILFQNKCIRCDDEKICNQNCSGDLIFDYLNQICSNTFKISTHELSSSQLLSSRFFTESQDFTITPTLPSTQCITHCFIDVNNNPHTLLSFLGSSYFTNQTVLKKSFTKLPKGYMKTIQFYALFYGNGNPTNLQVYINSQQAQINSNYITMISNEKICLNSGVQTQSIFKVEFKLSDYKSILNLELRSTIDKWAIRNVNIIISKCHYTCSTCYEGGTAADCATCPSGLILNKFYCTCQSGYFLFYKINCYDSPCVECRQCTIQNCNKCQDQTGRCVECANNYMEKDGQCTNVEQDSTLYKAIGQKIIRYREFINHFNGNNKRYRDYWQFSDGELTFSSCNNLYSYNSLQNNQYLLLKIKKQFQEIYHIGYYIFFCIQTSGNLDDNLGDHAEAYLNGQQLLNKKYSAKVQADPEKYASCKYPTYYDDYWSEPLTIYKPPNNMIEFKLQAFLAGSSRGFSVINLFQFYYLRCYPTCTDCTDFGQDKCLQCIENAEKINNICQCKDGFAFVYNEYPEKGNFPGKCLPCHPSCQTCSDVSFYACLVCRDGFEKINNSNICKYKCEDGMYLDSVSSSCKKCHSCCRTCFSDGINACHDCNSNFSLDITSHTCKHSIYNQQCDLPCTSIIDNYCGGTPEKHKTCKDNGWYQIDSTVCISCGNYVNNSCGGDQSLEVVNACKQAGYFNYNSSKCSSCNVLNGTACGSVQIMTTCSQNDWLQLNNSFYCVYCGNFVNGQCGGDQTQDVIDTCRSNGYFQVENTNKCSSCRFANSTGCGSSQIRDVCYNNNWIKFNDSDCIYCGNYILNFCGGEYTNSQMRESCLQNGYLNTLNGKCSSCKFPNGQNCGVNDIKNTCLLNNWIQLNSSVCVNCSSYSDGSCGGNYSNPDITNECLKYGYMKQIDNTCSSCRFGSGTGCGKNGIEKDCYSNNWIQLNSSECVYCGKYDSTTQQCGGDQPANVKQACIQGGYYSYIVNNVNYCSTCKDIQGSGCGRSEIYDQCKQNKWTKYDSSTCMNCSISSQTFSQCVCDSSCKTCDTYFNSKACTSCIPLKVFYAKECLDKCPGGYSPNSNNECVLTCSLILNSICGGSTACAISGWEKRKDNSGCVKCTQYNILQNNCGQDQVQDTLEACLQGGYYKSDDTICSTCQELQINQCGKSEIQQVCKQNHWYYDLYGSCVNCSNNSLTLNQCICHPNCNECVDFFDEKACKNCKGNLFFFQNQCLPKCPDGYSPNSQKICVLTCSLVFNSLCGGSQICGNNGWEQKDSIQCVFCGNFQNNFCGGDLNQDEIVLCEQRGYKKYNSNQCSSCKIVNGTDCGRDEIKEICFQQEWIKYNLSSCMNCNKNSITYNQCQCDSTCNKCERFFTPTACESCSSTLLYFNKQCLTKCPNGYIDSGQKCNECSDIQMPNCFNCYKTCQICTPFQVSNIPNSCTACSSTRKLIKGECKCKDDEDARDIMFECSYLDTAVIEPILSNSKPQLTINFAKKINAPIDYKLDTFSTNLCKFIFEQQTLAIFGTQYQCLITSTFIIVEFDNGDSTIFNGNHIYLQKDRLSYSSSPEVLITKFFNNVVVQQHLEGDSKVIFNYATNPNYCDDISLVFTKLVNSGGRNIKSFKWAISPFTQSDISGYQMLNNLLEKYTNEKKLDIFIPKGVIKPEIKTVIRLEFTLQVDVTTYEDFPIQVKIEKQLYLDIKTQIISPFYRFQQGILSFVSNVVQCDPSGNINIIEPISIQISSDQVPDFNFSNSSYLLQERNINIDPFTLPTTNIIINVQAFLVSNPFITGQISFTIDVQQSKLRSKIIGGNGYFNYNKKVEIFGKVRDPDLPTEDEPQGISISWKCIDPGTQNTCVSKLGDLIEFLDEQNSITFSPSTFNPYTVVRVELKGEKPIKRISIDTVVIMFSELDLPPLGVQVQSQDPASNTINLNEEIFVVLNYSNQVNVDLLSFSGTIVYENEVVGLIKFDYFTLRFQIWNYYSNFKRENASFQVRFNIFNPKFYMPSMSLIPMNINFPPQNCKFTVNSDSDFGYSLETRYMLLMENCLDENKPIKYQFFFYKSKEDFESEKRNPSQVLRRQITDKQSANSAIASLPSGKLLLMAQAIDSKLAIYNTTYSIEVQIKQYDESSYLQLIQEKLDLSKIVSTESAIFELSILSEDILERNQFKISTSLNQKKIEIQNQLTYLSKLLPLLSTFVTLSDKAIASLNQSGISYSSTESINFIDDLINQLDQQLKDQQFQVDILKEKFKQKLYDNFQVLNSLSNQEITKIQDKSSQDKLINLQEKIGNYLLKNILPNEDPLIFKGSLSKILSNQVTEKHICTYFMCENSDGNNNDEEKNNNKQPNIYNVKMISQNQNFYDSDPTYQNYTSSLKAQQPNLIISQYPIITPSIRSDQDQPVLDFQNKVALKFQAKGENINPMSCLTKSKSGWTQKGCKNLYDPDSQTYTCMCNKLSPTTVIEDLELLLMNDNNLGVAFGSEGLNNLSNFNNFYEYGVFWTLLIYTGGCIFLFFKGRAIDILNSQQNQKQVLPIQLQFSDSPNQNTKLSQAKVVPLNISKEIDSKIQKSKSEFIKNGSEQKIDSICKLNTQRQQNMTESQNIQENQNLQDTPINMAMDTPLIEENIFQLENLNTSKEIQLDDKTSGRRKRKISGFTSQLSIVNQESLKKEQVHQEQKLIKIQEELSENMSERDKNINNDKFKKPNKQNQKQLKDQNIKTNNSDEEQSPKQNELLKEVQDKENKEKQEKEQKEKQKQEFKQYYQKIQNLKLYKKILIFHNFFSIFYIYNPNLSRSLRFLVFYVRIVHTLSISVIFDREYNMTQKIVIALINAITLTVVIKILEMALKIKQIIGKVISGIIILLLIGTYSYIILSIVSGQTPSDSNSFIATFLCMKFVDLAIVSTFIAFILQKIAQFLLEIQFYKKSSGWIKALVSIIEFECILSYLK